MIGGGSVKWIDEKGPEFISDEKEHVITSMVVTRQSALSGLACDVSVLFRDGTQPKGPTVEMEGRWRQKTERSERMEMRNVLMRFKREGSKNSEPDIEIWFDPKYGEMTGVQVNDAELQEQLKAVLENKKSWIARIEPTEKISREYLDDRRHQWPDDMCEFLSSYTGLEKEVFNQGFEVKRTMAQFIETGTVQERAGAVSPVIVKKAS